MHEQVRELCTDCGPIDGIWFDHNFRQPSRIWRSKELVEMIRQLQPLAVINSSLGKDLRNNTALGDCFIYEQIDYERKLESLMLSVGY